MLKKDFHTEQPSSFSVTEPHVAPNNAQTILQNIDVHFLQCVSVEEPSLSSFKSECIFLVSEIQNILQTDHIGLSSTSFYRQDRHSYDSHKKRIEKESVVFLPKAPIKRAFCDILYLMLS